MHADGPHRRDGVRDLLPCVASATRSGARTIVDYIEFINDEKSVRGDHLRPGRSQADRARPSSVACALMGKARARPTPEFMQRINGRMALTRRQPRTSCCRREPISERTSVTTAWPAYRGHARSRAQLIGRADEILDLLDGARRAKDRAAQLRSRASRHHRRAARSRFTRSGRMDDSEPALGAPGFRTRRALGAAEASASSSTTSMRTIGSASRSRSRTSTARSVTRSSADRLIKHVMLHELGHNVGLAHNFEGTYDALNYNDTFWDLHWATDEEKLNGQYQTSSGTRPSWSTCPARAPSATSWASTTRRPSALFTATRSRCSRAPTVDANLAGGESLRNWRYYNDYRKIPDYLCGGERLQQRRRSPQRTSARVIG